MKNTQYVGRLPKGFKAEEVGEKFKIICKGNKVYVEKKFDVNAWIANMYDSYLRDFSASCMEDEDEGVTVCYFYDSDLRVGISKCHEGDTFGREKGIAIAYARALGKGIPQEVLA